MHVPFWLTTGLLLPVLLYQGKRTRRITPRLPEASGAPCGYYGEGEPGLRILVIGESTAAGVGIDNHAQGLSSQLALALHQKTGKTVAWHTFGVNGIRLKQLNQELDKAELPEADIVLLSMGVNDTTGFTTRTSFRRQLFVLRTLLRNRYPSPIKLLSVPPMHRFTALPIPLRQIMGWRSRQLDQIYRQLASERPNEFSYLGYSSINDSELLARDGYHPSDKGYRAIAECLAETLRLNDD